MMTFLTATGPDLHAWVQFGPDAVTVYSAAPDAPCQDVAMMQPTPEEADAIALAFADWASRQRAKMHANAVPPLLALLDAMP